MRKQSSVYFLSLLCILGCGKSESSREEGLVDSGVPLPATTEVVPTDPPVTSSPPGKIELPQGFDAAAETADTPPAAEKKGGFEMPATTSDAAAPVIVQRPVLDETASTTNVKLTTEPLQTTLDRAAKAGKVCVVDVWSLSCEPCLKEFPGLVALSNELPEKIVCMSVNVDYDGRKSKPAETYRDRVEAFLKSTAARFENYLCQTPNEEVFAALKIPSIPAVLVYDRDGKLVRTFVDSGDDVGFSYANDISPLVRTLVSP